MSERRDYVALDWVAGEIEETLKQASESLDAYISNRDDATKLRFCLTHIHQVHGTLQMVEFFGAALLAEEMESLTEALAQGAIHESHVEDGLAVLKQAMEQLPLYLERVKESRHALPSTLLPVLNDLRSVRGESLFSETVLFSPDLSQKPQDSVSSDPVVSGDELKAVSQKLRQMFQIALLGLIRGQELKKNLNYLAKACARLSKITNGKPPQPLWRVCIAVLEGLLNGSIEASVSVKILLRHVDRQIKQLIDLGDEALDVAPPEDLLKNLLYYVARSKANSRFIKEIQAEYNLDTSLLGAGELEDEELATPDASTMTAVVEALAQELTDIKAGLESAGTDVDLLTEVLPQFRRVNDTMAILGMGASLKPLQEQHSALAKLLATQSSVTEDQLQDIISAVNDVVQQINPSAEEVVATVSEQEDKTLFNDSEEAQEKLDSAFDSVVKESRNGLEQAKESIIEFVATQWNHNCLTELPELLEGIRGGLAMIPLDRAANVLLSCEQYVKNELLANKSVPEWQMLDTLADAITSVDYYLERLADRTGKDTDNILDVAAESVAELGYPISGDVARSEATDAITTEAESPVIGLVDEPVIEDDIPTIEPVADSEEDIPELSVDQVEEQSVIDEQAADEESVPTVSLEAVAEPENNVEDFPVLEDPLEAEHQPLLDTSDDELESLSDEAVAEVAQDSVSDDLGSAEISAGSSDPLAIEAGGDLVVEDYDEEIAEIFIEEAREVLETIDEFLPQWIENHGDEEASSTVRRSFHTLKGSGRMAKAESIGELAWSVENMLNRVLDGTHSMDQQRFDLVTTVKSLVPAMVDIFEQQKDIANKAGIESLMAQAEALSKEQDPDMSVFAVAEQAEPAAIEDSEVAATDTIEEVEEDVPVLELVDQNEEDIPVLSEDEPAVEAEAEITLDDIDESDIPTIIDAGEDTQETAEYSELLKIFAAEAAVHQQVLDKFTAHCHQVGGPVELTDELQRALHTLKGSANMAGVIPVAMVVVPVENLVKELRASQFKSDAEITSVLENASQFIKSGVEQLETTPMQPLEGVDVFIQHVNELLAARLATATLNEDDSESIPPEALNEFLSSGLDLISDVEDLTAKWKAQDLPEDQRATLTENLEQFIAKAEAVNMHAPMELAEVMQALYRRGIQANTEPDPSFFAVAAKGNDSLIDMLDQIAGHQAPTFDSALFHEIQEYELSDIAPETEATSEQETTEASIDIEPAEERDVADIMADMMNAISAHKDDELSNEELPSAELSNEENGELTPVDETTDEDIDIPVLDDSASDMIDMSGADDDQDAVIEADAFDQMLENEVPLDDVAEEFMLDEDDGIEEDVPVITDEADESVDSTEDNESTDDAVAEISIEEPEAVAEPEIEASAESAPVVQAPAMTEDEEIDAEILEIFFEEAHDLLESIDESVHKWSDERDTREHLDMLLRDLHTLKGGARLSGLTSVGDLSHDFETFLEEVDESKVIDDAFLNQVQQYQDQLISTIEAINNGGAQPAPIEPEVVEDQASTAEASPADTPEETEDDAVTGEVLPFSPTAEPAKESKPAKVVPFTAQNSANPAAEAIANAVTNSADPNAKKGPQEVVKVSAQLLEELVNLAGETSISRGRAEEQISELVFSLEEMQLTVDRLQEQVRRLDMETEQQILYRQEQVEQEGLEGFDPLEMDRYSALQQLSRSLLESSSDLIDIKSTLADKSRDMEQLLVQQSRINTELQEGLMRSRMVPFSRMVPRLRRIIRQVSTELDKKVDFVLDNVEGELDRTVLERMVAPLEHMLRNAVDHGIETADVRAAAGKPKKGTVKLSLAREGGEIVLTLADDGAGVNIDAVKAKAIERGLMEANQELTDREITQFILAAGFSTAESVTQISGRGVGMDVVHSEIKQLGGSMEIESVQGQGSRFIVRLPFTLSVNRALMVSIGGDIYAIPLNTIEGIVRVSPFELEAYYQPDAPMFEYAGQPYLLRYMGALLRRGEKPNLEGQTMPLPVILVRGAEHSVAMQVDSLMGSREIVVKPLGPQFSMVQGLQGATVLGDGNVVVILDLLAMIRADAMNMYKDNVLTREEAEVEEDRSIVVMVVDDSVTVRKVTSRFLERQGMEVILAKDGLDAVTQLNELERLPDVMLLDIEMPRMDGFEVASRVKHTGRLKNIPIIMITSRTGEKHRERALSLGVDNYLGKPYQETQLLESINELTGVTQH